MASKIENNTNNGLLFNKIPISGKNINIENSIKECRDKILDIQIDIEIPNVHYFHFHIFLLVYIATVQYRASVFFFILFLSRLVKGKRS